MPKQQDLPKLIGAVKTPLGFLTLFLALIGLALGALLGMGHLTPQGSDIVALALIAGAVLGPLVLLWVLLFNPALLYGKGGITDLIESFRAIDEQLTAHDMQVLQNMLGKSPNYFTSFAHDVVKETKSASAARQQKLARLGFIREARSEVELTLTGTTYVQTICRYAAVIRPPRAPLDTRPLSLVSDEVAATDTDLPSFIQGLDPAALNRIMIIANTGQETVRLALTEIEQLCRSKPHETLAVQVLLRSPHLTDLRRAQNTRNTVEDAKRRSNTGSLTIESRFYAGASPFRAIIAEHKSGAHSGFLSFYDWHQRGSQAAAGTRDSASKHARIVSDSRSNVLLNACVSWFSHLWGKHALRTIIFDFDDTLFSTTEAQVSGWAGALRSLLNRNLIAPNDVAEPLRKVLDDAKATRDYIRDAFFEHQTEARIFAALIPDPRKDSQVFDVMRQERLAIRERETVRTAQLVPNLSPAELKRLSEHYALVIVSATDDRLIESVLERWDLRNLFPYIVGRETPRHAWLDLENKTQNLIRITNLLGVPLDRMVFVGDSYADYRSARQLGIKFIENRFNAEFYGKPSLIRDPDPKLEGVLSDNSKEGDLTSLLSRIESALH